MDSPTPDKKFNLIAEIKSIENFKDKQRRALNEVKSQIEIEEKKLEDIIKVTIDKAKIEARMIVSEAEEKKQDVKNLQKEVRDLRKKLKEELAELSLEKGKLADTQSSFAEHHKQEEERREKESDEYQKKISLLLSKFNAKIDQPESLLTDLVNLIILTTQKANYLLTMEREIKTEVVEMFVEAKKLYTKSSTINSMFKLQKDQLTAREQELKTKTLRLEDQQRTFKQAIKGHGL